MNASVLTSFGVSEKSAKIYLATLALGTTSVQDIAQKSGLKRPTVYLHIDELIREGMMEKVSLNKKVYYRVLDPSLLEARMQKKLVNLHQALPELSSMHAAILGKPQVRTFEGEKGVRMIYDEMLATSSIRAWSNVGKMNPFLFHNEYMRIGEKVREMGIGTREIVADNKESRRYSRLFSHVAGPTYQARVATIEGLANDNIIYNDVVAIFRLHEFNMFVVRIEDQTIADSARSLFDMAWKTAKTFK